MKKDKEHPKIRETLSIARSTTLTASILVIMKFFILIGLLYVVFNFMNIGKHLEGQNLSDAQLDIKILAVIILLLIIHTATGLVNMRRFLMHVTSLVTERNNEIAFRDALEAKLHQEVAERKTAELELAQSQDKVLSTLKSLGMATIVVDLKGSVDFANPAAEVLLGLPSEKITGHQFKRLYDILNATTRQKITPPLKEVLNTHEKQSSGTHLLLVRKDGKEILVSDSITPLVEKNGDIQGFVVVIQDLSQHQLLEEQLRESHKMEAIGQLSAGIATDFNNLTSNILMVADLLASKTQEDSTDGKYINNLLETAHKAQDLSQQLSAFSQRQSEEFITIDIHRIINNVAEILSHSIDKRINIVLKLDAPESMIVGNPNHLQSTILELCVIAKNSVGERGEIFIASRTIDLDRDFCRNAWTPVNPGPHIHITVSDNGTGLSGDEKEDAKESLAKGGTDSVGLSLICSSLEMHHGTCFLYSEKGIGSVYNIFLPLNLKPEKIDNGKKAEKIPQAQKNKGILVVDDEELLRELLNNSLTDLGYKVDLAENGQEAVSIYREKQDNIDLIIMDMIMPVMNGREALEEIQKINPKAKVIIASGFSRNEEIEKCMQIGITAYVQKPYILTDLTNKIRQAIDS